VNSLDSKSLRDPEESQPCGQEPDRAGLETEAREPSLKPWGQRRCLGDTKRRLWWHSMVHTVHCCKELSKSSW
jgi:hypothetical protein